MTNTNSLWKEGDLVRRQKEHLKEFEWAYGERAMKVVRATRSGIQFENDNRWYKEDFFDAVCQFKEGDYVTRKPEFADDEAVKLYGWTRGTTPQLITGVSAGYLHLEGSCRSWQAERFDLHDKPSYFVRQEIDRATKPLHHTIELREARIRVLESDLETVGARYQKVIDDQARRNAELEITLAAVKSGRDYDHKRLSRDNETVTADLDYWKSEAKSTKARITILEHAFDEAKCAIRMLKATTDKAASMFNG